MGLDKERREGEVIARPGLNIRKRVMMVAAKSWKEAKEIAEKEGEELVFHNFDTGEYGTCPRSKRFGCYRKGEFIEERCICIPAKFTTDELEEKEKKFLEENPEWGKGEE